MRRRWAGLAVACQAHANVAANIAKRLASQLPRIHEKTVSNIDGAAEKMAKLNKGDEARYNWLQLFLDWFDRYRSRA